MVVHAAYGNALAVCGVDCLHQQGLSRVRG